MKLVNPSSAKAMRMRVVKTRNHYESAAVGDAETQEIYSVLRTGRKRSGMSYTGIWKWWDFMTALFILRAALRDVRAVRVHTLSLGALPSGRPCMTDECLRHQCRL